MLPPAPQRMGMQQEGGGSCWVRGAHAGAGHCFWRDVEGAGGCTVGCEEEPHVPPRGVCRIQPRHPLASVGREGSWKASGGCRSPSRTPQKAELTPARLTGSSASKGSFNPFLQSAEGEQVWKCNWEASKRAFKSFIWKAIGEKNIAPLNAKAEIDLICLVKGEMG